MTGFARLAGKHGGRKRDPDVRVDVSGFRDRRITSGLSFLVGGIMLIDLRVLGFARTLPLKSDDRSSALGLGGLHHQHRCPARCCSLRRHQLRHKSRVLV